MATVARIERAGRRFGDVTDNHYLTAKRSGAKDSSRPLTTPTPPFDGRAEFNTWGERRGSNPLPQVHSLSANLFAFAHHNLAASTDIRRETEELEPPARVELASPRYKGGSLPLTYGGSNWSRRRELNPITGLTKAVCNQQHFDGQSGADDRA